MEDFKARLWRLMQKNNLNNSSLGRLLDKAPSTVKFWREGKWPEMPTIEKIAEVLNVTPAYLLYGIEDSGKPYNVKNHQSTQVAELETTYGIPKEDLIEFYQWKAQKSKQEAESALKQAERLKSDKVDAI